MRAPVIKTLSAGAIVLTFLALFSWASSRAREQAVLKVRPGMPKHEVEKLLGPGVADQSGSADTAKWPTNRQQFSYRANPSLWYGRWEDALIVSYTNDAVSNTERCGL
jgi:hypothetical protein